MGSGTAKVVKKNRERNCSRAVYELNGRGSGYVGKGNHPSVSFKGEIADQRKDIFFWTQFFGQRDREKYREREVLIERDRDRGEDTSRILIRLSAY